MYTAVLARCADNELNFFSEKPFLYSKEREFQTNKIKLMSSGHRSNEIYSQRNKIFKTQRALLYTAVICCLRSKYFNKQRNMQNITTALQLHCENFNRRN